MKLLVVEDEYRVADFIVRGLKAERYTVELARDGVMGLELASRGDFDVIVLDLLLPGMSGLELCQTLRQRRISTPILMVSALDAVADRVEGLRLGADDYLSKPFEFEELLARIEALARRPARLADSPGRIEVGGLVFDCETLEVRQDGALVKLTAKELAILELLLLAPGKVFSRERILNNVWGASADPLTNIVDVYVARLRKKLRSKDGGELVETIRGVGYRISSPAQGE